MGLFGRRSEDVLRQEVASLLAQLSDKDELILKLIEQSAAERKELLEALLAATRPGVVAELHRQPRPERLPETPPRVNFPGLRRDPRPPVPPLQAIYAGGEPASSAEAEVALQKAVDRLNQ